MKKLFIYTSMKSLNMQGCLENADAKLAKEGSWIEILSMAILNNVQNSLI